MSVEIPKDQPSNLNRRFLNSVDQLVLWIKRKGFEKADWEQEIYNQDRKRKFFLQNLCGRTSESSRMVNLMSRLGRGWVNLMGVREYRREKSTYLIEISSLREGEDGLPIYPIYYYDQSKGGRKTESPYTAYEYPLYSVEKINSEIPLSGIVKEVDLPEFIDFEKTATTFLAQLNTFDFSNPVLFPKELVEDSDKKVLEQ